MIGKERCKILKEIRTKIALENEIEYVTSECTYKGECKGTCPKCEAELRYLERALERRARLGKSIAVAGIAATVALTGVGCTDTDIGSELGGDVVTEQTDGIMPTPDNESQSDVPYIDENGNEISSPELEGDIVDVVGEVPEYFFPYDIEEYEGYSENFISTSLVGMHVDDVKSAWGDADMHQVKGNENVDAYFADTQDIIIYSDAQSGIITKVETQENE